MAVASSASRLHRRAALAGYLAAIQEDRPLGYWPLDEPGTPFADRVGAHPLVVTGTGLTYQSDKLIAADGPKVAKLTAATTYAAVADATFAAFPGAAPFTAEAWVIPTTIDANDRIVLGTYSSGAAVGGWNLHCNSTNQWRARRSDGSTSNTASGGTATAGLLYHVAVTFHTRLRVFVNGSRVADAAAGLSIPAGTPAFRAGQRGNTAANANFLGWVGHLAVYDYALPEPRLLAHYRSGALAP